MSAKAKKVGPFGGSLPSVVFNCPGCGNAHAVPYTTQRPPPAGPQWFFDENFDSPTIEPSLLIFQRDGKTAECHVVVTNGILNYQSECVHSLAGKSVPMQDWKDTPAPDSD